MIQLSGFRELSIDRGPLMIQLSGFSELPIDREVLTL